MTNAKQHAANPASNNDGNAQPNGLGTRPSIFAEATAELSEKMAGKLTALQSVKQRLAEVADLIRAGDAKHAEAQEGSASVAFDLYGVRADNIINTEELSNILGDHFGFKVKSDGKPSKTPNGQGESIRKRVLRAVEANAYVAANGNVDKGFFKGLPVDEVNEVLLSLSPDKEAGTTVFAAYEAFAKVRTDHRIKTDMAYDVKRIAALVESLSEDAAPSIIAASPALIAAYAGLLATLQIVDERAAAIRDHKAATEA